jgi:hypothetical protein
MAVCLTLSSETAIRGCCSTAFTMRFLRFPVINSSMLSSCCDCCDASAVVPPGYGLVYPLPSDLSVSAVELCSSGYNAGWNRQPCTPCGVNISSRNNRTSSTAVSSRCSQCCLRTVCSSAGCACAVRCFPNASINACTSLTALLLMVQRASAPF